jgi:hypothetical protein
MESQELLNLVVLEPALRKRRARHHRVAAGHLIDVDVPLGGSTGREPKELLGPHHVIHGKELPRPPDQRRVTGV